MFLLNITYKRIILTSILLMSLSRKPKALLENGKDYIKLQENLFLLCNFINKTERSLLKSLKSLRRNMKKTSLKNIKLKNKPKLGLTTIKNSEKVGKLYKKTTIFHPVIEI